MGIASGLGLIILLIVVAMVGYTFFTDELKEFFETVDERRSETPDLDIQKTGNIAGSGDLICDLRITIPFFLENQQRSGVGGAFEQFISGATAGLSEGIAEFLNQPRFVYTSTAGQSWQWFNCYEKGGVSLASLLPIVSLNIFNDRLEQLGIFSDNRNFELTAEQLSLFEEGKIQELGLLITPETSSDKVVFTLEGFSKTNSDKKLVDKNNDDSHQDTIRFQDGNAFPVSSMAVFEIGDVKVDDYEIELTAKSQPINDKIIGVPFKFDLCGLDGTLKTGLQGKSGC